MDNGKMKMQAGTAHFILHNQKRRRLSEAYILLMASSSYLLREGLAVSSSPSSRYHQNELMKTSISSYSASQRGGGGLTSKEENEQLDAYIEDLISTIETDEENTKSASEALSNYHEDMEEEEGKEDEDEDTDSTVIDKEEEEEISSIIKEPNAETESIEEGSDSIVKQDTEDKVGVSPKQKAKRKKKKKTSTTTQAEKHPNINMGDDIAKSTSKLSTQPNNDSPATSPTAKPTDTRIRRPHPPNALYRFLLHQGLVGHVLVMFLILCVEWIYAYLPPLANFLSWLWTRIFGQYGVVVGGDYPYYDRDNEPVGVKATQTSVAAVRSRRTGQTGKQRRALTRQADEASLAQLKRIGNVQQAKYRHVSLDFMQRHGLGPFAGDRQDLVHSVRKAEEEEGVSEASKKIRRAKKEIVARKEEEEDVDWVLQALSSNLPTKSSGGLSVKPAVSVGVGSDGVSVGVEFSLGRRQAVLDAVTSERKKKKNNTGPRASDRDGGDGIFGRLRAATGANSRVSRSLLGAYPGDAVPLDQAASVQGVADLAQKYGWGDWSDEDDDDSNIPVFRKRKKRKKRRVETRRSPTIGVEFNFSRGKTKPPVSSQRKGSSRVSSSTEELPSKSTSLSARRTLEGIEGSERRRRVRRHKIVRPALERISEVRRKTIDDDDVP